MQQKNRRMTMSKQYHVKLEYIKATDTVKQVCLLLTDQDNKTQKCIYVLNQDKDDNSFNKYKQANKTAFKFTSNLDTIIHNMYSTKDMFYKSAIYDKGKSERTGTTYDFKNIFSHNLAEPYKDAIQVDNTIYSIADLSPYGHINISSDSYQFLAEDNNNVTLVDKDIETCLYDRDAVSAVVAGDDSARDNVVSKKFIGVQYNTMLEIPGSIYNEHDSGNIAANAFKGKNQYNSLFDMEHMLSTNDNLQHARSYIKIDNCNDQIYFKYYDNIDYLSASQTQNGVQRLSANVSQQHFSNNQKFQNIETIDYISRYANQYGHKSGLYSVVVKTDVFDDENIKNNSSNESAESQEAYKEHIRQLLKNNVKTFVKNITKRMMPANTQLFSVTV